MSVSFTEESDLVVSIRDTGVGIPEEKIPKLFRVFAQVCCSCSFHGTELLPHQCRVALAVPFALLVLLLGSGLSFR